MPLTISIMKNKAVFIVMIIAVVSLASFYFYRGNSIGEIIEKNESFNVYKVAFDGYDGNKIYGLLFSPLKKEYDAVIVLPAAAGTKESRRFYGEILAEMGYGSLILDQRGIGETGGENPSLQEDFNAYLQNKDVEEILMARDAVSAVDFLEKIKGVKEIGILGESMGGRNAIIAAGLDERIKTAIIISSAGYFTSFNNEIADKFLEHINPNSYIGKIAPRRILMLHAVNDSVISIEDARNSFLLAKEPKKFIEFDEKECLHGYCKPMHDSIRDELREAFG